MAVGRNIYLKWTIKLLNCAHFRTVTYLAGAYTGLERVCAHLILTDTTSEVFVAFLVTKNWYLGHVEDSLISSPFGKHQEGGMS